MYTIPYCIILYNVYFGALLYNVYYIQIRYNILNQRESSRIDYKSIESKKNSFPDSMVSSRGSGRGFKDYIRWFVCQKISVVYCRFQVTLFQFQISECSSFESR